MSKDNRTIHSHIRGVGKVYTPGMEDELQSALSPEQLARLQEKGAISGQFDVQPKAKKAEEPAPEPEPEPAEETTPTKGKNK